MGRNLRWPKADKLLNVKGHMSKWDLDQFINCDTLRAFDIEILINQPVYYWKMSASLINTGYITKEGLYC